MTIPQSYIHRSRDGFDTELKLNLPQKFIFIPLDVFSKITYTVDRSMERELVAWLLFLSSDKLDDIVRIIDAYPFFAEMYEEMAEFQRKPEELIGMYSEALAIMDRNTVRYMIEEQKKENEEQKRENERLRLEGEELRVKNERQCQENERQRQENERQRQESEQQCQAQKREIEQLRQLLNQKA